MSLTDVATSTLSTIIDKVIIVVNDVTNSSSGSISSGYISGISISSTSNSAANNSTMYHYTDLTTTAPPTKPTYDTTGVAHGVGQAKVIAVMTMLTVFSIFGCLGNGLVLYVFSKKSDKVTSTIFILALAWTDFFNCLIFMPFTAAYIKLNSQVYLDFFCKLYQFLNTCNVPLSAFIMVAIAVDRYFSICHPFVHVVTPRRARLALLSLVLVAFTLGSITACIYGVHKSTNSTSVSLYSNITQDISVHMKDNHTSGDQLSAHSSVTDHSDNNTRSGMAISEPGSLNSPEAGREEPADGVCGINELIFSSAFIELFHKVYISFFGISLVAVFTLYFLIYRSVAERRAWRRKQKSWSHSPLTMTAAVVSDVDNGNKFNDVYVGDFENLELSPQNHTNNATNSDSRPIHGGDASENAKENATMAPAGKVATVSTTNSRYAHENGLDNSKMSSLVDKKLSRERRDFNFLANIRTAIMLFVVTLVFIISFLPAWLMATQLIPFEIIIFYMHFVYNVANPVIYAFMNQSFRKELKRVFQRDCGLKCCKKRHRLSTDRTFSRMTAISICDSPVDPKGHNPIYKSPSSDS